jgi:SAM-dependent methyltransferase
MAGTPRPFYGEYAWAFDLLIDRPVAKECTAIADWLVERGVVPGARLLDAGCGTGRYAIELGRRGYVVEGVDQSPELVDVAKRSAIHQPGSVSFHVGDLLALPDHGYHAILCRGVLNDLVDPGIREAVFSSFAGALRRGCVLILDVFRKSVETDRGKLTFTSITELDPERQQLLLSETHTLVNDAGEHSRDYRFVMRCWTRSELESVFERVGFGSVEYFGAYDPAVHAGATDRLVAVARVR